MTQISGKDLEERLNSSFDELRISQDQRSLIVDFLAPLKNNQITKPHYEHSLRVGLLAKKIARFMHLDEKALLYAGLMHDLGKSKVDLDILGKTEGWTDEDTEKIKKHVIEGYELIKNTFNFSAEIIARHHKFQENSYPEQLPEYLNTYSAGTKASMDFYARILSIADNYDALHRVNNKFEGKKVLNSEEIQEKMFELNPDQKKLIDDLYRTGVFFQEKSEEHKLHEDISKYYLSTRTPRETGRQVMLSAALEPISDKKDCTTRYVNASRHLKLEYFITAGINIGDSFEELSQRIAEMRFQPRIIYDLALRAQRDSARNRAGGRINQGIIELLIPIVASQYINDVKCEKTVEEILNGATKILKSTSREDVDYLIEMKKLANELSCYTDRKVPEHPDAKTVFEYYLKDLKTSEKPTGKAHNGEFVNGFPTVKLMYKKLTSSKQEGLSEKAEEAYNYVLGKLDENVGRGFPADCVAAAIYLWISQNPKEKIIN